MTKSDAMGDKYGLTAESSSNTKDAQLSTRLGQKRERKYCHSQDNVAPVQKMLFISSGHGVPGCGGDFNAVSLCNSCRKRCLFVAREYFSKQEMIRISRWRSAIAKYVKECYWNEESFMSDYTARLVSPHNSETVSLIKLQWKGSSFDSWHLTAQ